MAVCISAAPFDDALAASNVGSAVSAPFGCRDTRNTTTRCLVSARPAGGFQHSRRRALNVAMSFSERFAALSAASNPELAVTSGELSAVSNQLLQGCGRSGFDSACEACGAGADR